MNENIIVYCCYWRDRLAITDMVDSIKKHVGEIIVHDGRYIHWPGQGIESDDGIRRYCVDEGLTYINEKRAYMTQMKKRDMAFSLIPDGKWILILDADEVVLNGWVLEELGPPGSEKPEAFVKKVTMYDIGGESLHWRLVWNMPGWSHGKNHYDLCMKGKSFPYWSMSELKILHLRDKRPIERLKLKDIYYQQVYIDEKQEEDVVVIDHRPNGWVDDDTINKFRNPEFGDEFGLYDTIPDELKKLRKDRHE